MSQTSGYSAYHPRWHRHRVSTYWWASRGSYFAFILRELSSIFVAWFIVYLMLLLLALGRGPAGYAAFMKAAGHPVVIAVNVVTLFFILLHAITWFNLAPQAMVIKVAGRRVPGIVIALQNYAMWVVASAVVLWLLIGA